MGSERRYPPNRRMSRQRAAGPGRLVSRRYPFTPCLPPCPRPCPRPCPFQKAGVRDCPGYGSLGVQAGFPPSRDPSSSAFWPLRANFMSGQCAPAVPPAGAPPFLQDLVVLALKGQVEGGLRGPSAAAQISDARQPRPRPGVLQSQVRVTRLREEVLEQPDEGGPFLRRDSAVLDSFDVDEESAISRARERPLSDLVRPPGV